MIKSFFRDQYNVNRSNIRVITEHVFSKMVNMVSTWGNVKSCVKEKKERKTILNNLNRLMLWTESIQRIVCQVHNKMSCKLM